MTKVSDYVGGQESTSEQVTEPTGNDTSIQTEDHSQETQPQSNPFWKDVEEKLGPNNYKVIQPYLAKADEEARKRIESVNQSYAPWKAFADQGIAPAQVQQAIGVVQQLNTSPEQVFESLRSFLEREGRLPNQAELKQEVIEDENEAEGGEDDPRLTALAQQNQAIMEYLQGQQLSAQQQAAAHEADTWLESEVTRLKDPKNGYDDEDIKEIVRIAAFQSQQSGQDPDSLDQAAAQFNAMRDRIRTAPRAGQLAPRIPSGPGGGTPQGGDIDPSSLSPAQRRELAAAVMARAKAQQ